MCSTQQSVVHVQAKRTQILPLFTSQDYLHCCQEVGSKLFRYLRIRSSPRVDGLYVPGSDWFRTIYRMSIRWSLGGSSLCWPLADLQHIGADMEADVGEVLLRTESWDVTDYLLGRGRWKNAGDSVSHTNTSNRLKPIIAPQETLCIIQIKFFLLFFLMQSLWILPHAEVILALFVCSKCSTLFHIFTSLTVIWQGHG